MGRILVIEDDPQVRAALKQLLVRHGHEVDTAGDGQAGLDRFSEARHDLIVTDIILPEKEGVAMMVDLHREFPQTKVVAISGGGRFPPEIYLEMAEAVGALATFSKPFDYAKFMTTIEEILISDIDEYRRRHKQTRRKYTRRKKKTVDEEPPE